MAPWHNKRTIQTFNDSKLISPTSPFGPSLSSPERTPTCNKARGVREFEEELNSLRKENFDLKMRVYVLNEQMELFQSIDNAEQLYEVNANQKKEIEKLKTDLSEKEDLLIEAGDTMDDLKIKHSNEIANLKMEWEEKCSELENMNLRLQREYEKLIAEQRVAPFEPSLLDSTAKYAAAFPDFPSTVMNASTNLELENLRLEENLAEKLKIVEENVKLMKEQEKTIQNAQLRIDELEKELKSKTESLSCAYKELREKEHAHLQMCKKAHELEEQLSLNQMELDNLRTRLESIPTPDNLRELRNKYERCATENNILVNKITELECNLKEVESKNARIENKQGKCQTCRHYRNLEGSLDKVREELSRKEQELNSSKEEQLNTLTALRGCLKANRALTADIEALNEKLTNCGCSDTKISQQEELQQTIRSFVDKVSQLQREKDVLMASSKENIIALQEQLREKDHEFEVRKLAVTTESTARINELESQISGLKNQLEELSSKEAALNAENKQLVDDVEVKKKYIDRLNEELRKKTFNLQEIVNKELWDKNREIEKLNKSNERKQGEIVLLKERLVSQEKELDQLNAKMQDLSEQVLACQSIPELKATLAEEIEKRTLVESERDLLVKSADESEKARKELMNACCLFKARLEELATFLESLLPCLGSKKRKILQDAIDRSREASRTLSQSVMHESGVNETTLTVPILPDFSQVDFCSDNDIDVTIEDKKSGIEPGKIDNLKSKVDSIVQQLGEVCGVPEKPKMCWKINNYEDKFDFAKLANMSSSFNIEEVSEVSFNESFTDSASAAPSRQPSLAKVQTAGDCPNKGPLSAPLSESEGWSEPDRNVSMARIGLRDSSVPVGALTTEESSDNSCKVSVCKRRCEVAEIRRLSLKVRSLERVINSMKAGETRSSSREASPLAGESSEKFESAVKDLKREKEKLETSLKNNKEILNELALFDVNEPANGKELLKAFHMIADQFEQIYSFFTKMDDHYLVVEEEKEALSRVLLEKERKIEVLNKEIASLQVAVKEKDNEVLEKQCSLLEARNSYILLEKQCKTMQMTIDEMNQWKMAVEKSGEELEAMKESYLKEINNLKNKLQEREDEVNGLKSSLDRAFKRIDDVCLKKVLMENEFKQKVDELQREKRIEVETEVNKRIEAERKLVETYEGHVELRKRFEEEITKNKNIEMAQKSSERWWRRRTEEVESSCADREAELRRRLDNATIATSQAVLERTRLANEKIRLQCELRRRENSAHDMRAELEQRISELEEANQELTRKLKTLWSSQPLSDVESPPPFSRQRSHPTSDYTSDPDQLENKGSNSNLNHWFPVCGRSNNNCSPDLGIESDHGRLSSLDPPTTTAKSYGDLEREIAHLKRELARKSRLLDDSHRASKIVKEKLEDKIYSELGKTQELLEKTKMNFKKSS